MSAARSFADRNVLIYSIEDDGPDQEKGAIARELIEATKPCISTQVLGEFCHATTGKRRRRPLAHAEACAWVVKFHRLEVCSITPDHVTLALEIRGRFGLSYYDSLILATAKLAGCAIVYSEDMNHGQDYDGVRVENPFLTETNELARGNEAEVST